MASLPRLFRRGEPESLKGIRERSAVVRSAELSMKPFRPGLTGEEARAALERSRAARRAAEGTA
jgi:hypothetical protein